LKLAGLALAILTGLGWLSGAALAQTSPIPSAEARATPGGTVTGLPLSPDFRSVNFNATFSEAFEQAFGQIGGPALSKARYEVYAISGNSSRVLAFYEANLPALGFERNNLPAQNFTLPQLNNLPVTVISYAQATRGLAIAVLGPFPEVVAGQLSPAFSAGQLKAGDSLVVLFSDVILALTSPAPVPSLTSALTPGPVVAVPATGLGQTSADNPAKAGLLLVGWLGLTGLIASLGLARLRRKRK